MITYKEMLLTVHIIFRIWTLGVSDFLRKGSQSDIVLFLDIRRFLSDLAPSVVNATEQTLSSNTSDKHHQWIDTRKKC